MWSLYRTPWNLERLMHEPKALGCSPSTHAQQETQLTCSRLLSPRPLIISQEPCEAPQQRKTVMLSVELRGLQTYETQALQRLLQFYYFESSEWSNEEIGSDGLYDGLTAADLQQYIDSNNGNAQLIRIDGILAGFVILDKIELEGRLLWELADFFILPKYRGGWIALEAVRQVFAEFEQPMAASTFKHNKRALRFFKAVAKRANLTSVREFQEPECSAFHTFIVNEPGYIPSRPKLHLAPLK